MSKDSQNSAPPKDGKSAGALRSWLMIALVAALFFSFYKVTPNDVSSVRELTQIQFFKALDEGKIVEPVTRFIDRDEGETYLTGEMETDEADKDGKPLADNAKTIKIFSIMNQIGKKPVLAFGNSGGDSGMLEYTLQDNKYRSMSFFVISTAFWKMGATTSAICFCVMTRSNSIGVPSSSSPNSSN